MTLKQKHEQNQDAIIRLVYYLSNITTTDYEYSAIFGEIQRLKKENWKIENMPFGQVMRESSQETKINSKING